MGRERNEQVVIRSSIVLLQERFRQLQRVREMKAERELLRTTDLNPKPYDHQTLYYNNEATRFSFFQFLPLNSSTSQVSLSLCLESSQRKQTDVEKKLAEMPLLASFWPSDDKPKIKTPLDYNVDGLHHTDDVDTSLHL